MTDIERMKLADMKLFLKRFVEIIDLAMYNQPREWIPVSERLPEERQSVLVCDRTSVYMANRHDDWWYFSPAEIGTCVAQSHIIAWMPLPEPWKGEQNEKSD